MTSLVDTNILVYRFDDSEPDKQSIAKDLLRRGVSDGSLRLAHQAIVEFIAATTSATLLTRDEAHREAEELLAMFDVVYPTEPLVRTAIRGAATYGLSWYDAHMWAYAEHYGLSELLSEDYQDGRRYGTVRVRNPFL